MDEIKNYFNKKKSLNKIDNAATLSLPASKWLQQAYTMYNQAIITLVQDETFLEQKIALGPSLIEIVLPYIERDTYESFKDDIEVNDSNRRDLDEILQSHYILLQFDVSPLDMTVELLHHPELVMALYARAVLDFFNEDSDEVVHKANTITVIALYEAFHQEIEGYLKKQGHRHLSIQVDKEQIHLFPMRRTVKEHQIKCLQILGYLDPGISYAPHREFKKLWNDTLVEHITIPDRIEHIQFQIDMKQCKEVENEIDMEITKTEFLDSFKDYMIDAVHPVFNRVRSNDTFGIYLKDKDQELPIESLLVGLFDYIWEEPIKFLFIALTIYESFKKLPEDKTLQKLATSTYYLLERYRTAFQEVIDGQIGWKMCSFSIMSYESADKEYQELILTNTRNIEAYNKWAKR